jgi:hypothetical protein
VGKMSATPNRQKEVDDNLNAFLAELPKIPQENRGKFALLRHGKIVGYFDSPLDAASAGNLKYTDKLFSIQQVTEAAVDLGYYSHGRNMGST